MIFLRILCLMIFVVGCAPVKTKISVPEKPRPDGLFEKVEGSLKLLQPTGALIAYKDIHILIDPPSSLTLGSLPPIDYVVFTDSKISPPSTNFVGQFRRSIKIITNKSGVKNLSAHGLKNVKGVGGGPTLLLEKKGAHLFLRAFDASHEGKETQFNNYFLEFDNGRGVLFAGPISKSDQLRPFLYTLRDDGKEIDLAFFKSDQKRTNNEMVLADVLGLLQPRWAVLYLDSPTKDLSQYLEEQLFEGKWFFSRPGESISF